MRKKNKSILEWLSKGAAALLALLTGNEVLKNLLIDTFKDVMSNTRRDELVCEAVLSGLKGVNKRFKNLLTEVRSDIERDYREYVIRGNGTERQYHEARDAKEKKDGALMVIGQSPKDPKTGRYLEGELVARKIFEGIEKTMSDEEIKEIIRRNLLTIGTDRRELSKSKRAYKILGDFHRRARKKVKKILPPVLEVLTSEEVAKVSSVVGEEFIKTAQFGIKTLGEFLAIFAVTFSILTAILSFEKGWLIPLAISGATTLLLGWFLFSKFFGKSASSKEV